MRSIAGLALAAVLAAPVTVRAGDDTPAPRAAAVPQYDGKTAAEWISQLASADVKDRQKAAYALFQLGPDTATAVPLARALRDADDYVRATASKALRKLAPEALRSAAPDLGAALGDDRPSVARDAASAFWRMGSLPPEAIPALMKALASSDAVVRENAAASLGNAGSPAKPAIEALTKALIDDVDGVRSAAARSIAQQRSRMRTPSPDR